MPWYIPHVPEGIKKRVCIYLLQRYLGQFFEEKLTLDQLSVDLYNGTGTVEDVSLDVQALNELGEKQNWPMEFVDGYLKKLSITVPWTSLLRDSSFVEVEGLKLTVQPKQRTESATSMFESMWSSMSSSIQLAQECMKQDVSSNIDNLQPLEGIERFAQTIDSILRRVKVKFINTIIQVEHVPKNSLTGVGMQIKISVMEYFDESGRDPVSDEAVGSTQDDKTYVVSSFTCKDLYLEGVTLSTIEFPSRARTFSRSVIGHSQVFDRNEEKQDSIVTMVQNTDSDNNVNSHADSYELKENTDDQRHIIMFGKITGRQEIRIRLKQSESINGPKVSIETNFGSFSVFLSPRQVHILLELVNGLSSPHIEDTSNVPPRQKCTEKPMTGLDYQRIEQELQQQIQPLSTFQTTTLSEGWSRPPLGKLLSATTLVYCYYLRNECTSHTLHDIKPHTDAKL
ncbi:Atg2 [Trypoxylus dichotomus]